MGKGSRARHEREEAEALLNPGTNKKPHLVRNIILTVIGVLLAALVLFGVLYSTGTIQRYMTAMQVGDQKINTIEYSYYYSQIRQNYLNQYGSYLSQMGMDTTNIDSQKYSDKLTFGEMFRKQTESQLSDTYALYSEAMKKNYKMSDDAQAKLKTTLGNLKTSAEEQKTTELALLRSVVSAPITVKDYNAILTRAALASDYYNSEIAKDSYTDEELKSYYNENTDQFDSVDYRLFQVFFESSDDKDATAKNKEAAKAKADAMLAEITDEKSFIAAAKKYATDDEKAKNTYAEDASTLKTASDLSTASGTVADWYKDPARKPGDKAVLEIDTNYTVIYFVDRYLDDYKTVNVRHILLKSDTTNDAEIKTKAEALLQKWKDGEATEDSFAKLATENTEDTGSAANGGLYENIYKGQMDTAFNDWCFNTAHKAGDTGIVKTSYGYHLMYFSGEGEVYWKSKAESSLKTKDYSDYVDGLLKKATVKTHSYAVDIAI